MRGRILALVTLLAAGGLLLACGPKETPAQRVTRLRQQYRVEPNGFQPRTGPEGTPQLVLSLLVTNTGKPSLHHLTVMVRVENQEGKEIAAKPVTLDVSSLYPGVPEQLSAVVDGVEFEQGDSVLVELENAPTVSEQATYPEYSDALS
jgi:hypothetical protein